MIVATWKVHLVNGFFLNWSVVPGQGHGYEFNLALIGALVSLMLTGPGALSVDGQRARSAEAEAYGRAGCGQGKCDDARRAPRRNNHHQSRKTVLARRWVEQAGTSRSSTRGSRDRSCRG